MIVILLGSVPAVIRAEFLIVILLCRQYYPSITSASSHLPLALHASETTSASAKGLLAI